MHCCKQEDKNSLDLKEEERVVVFLKDELIKMEDSTLLSRRSEAIPSSYLPSNEKG